jgi:hypothetical protein
MLAPRVLALGMVYFCAQTPLYSLGFFLPQIVPARMPAVACRKPIPKGWWP